MFVLSYMGTFTCLNTRIGIIRGVLRPIAGPRYLSIVRRGTRAVCAQLAAPRVSTSRTKRKPMSCKDALFDKLD